MGIMGDVDNLCRQAHYVDPAKSTDTCPRPARAMHKNNVLHMGLVWSLRLWGVWRDVDQAGAQPLLTPVNMLS